MISELSHAALMTLVHMEVHFLAVAGGFLVHGLEAVALNLDMIHLALPASRDRALAVR